MVITVMGWRKELNWRRAPCRTRRSEEEVKRRLPIDSRKARSPPGGPVGSPGEGVAQALRRGQGLLLRVPGATVGGDRDGALAVAADDGLQGRAFLAGDDGGQGTSSPEAVRTRSRVMSSGRERCPARSASVRPCAGPFRAVLPHGNPPTRALMAAARPPREYRGRASGPVGEDAKLGHADPVVESTSTTTPLSWRSFMTWPESRPGYPNPTPDGHLDGEPPARGEPCCDGSWTTARRPGTEFNSRRMVEATRDGPSTAGREARG